MHETHQLAHEPASVAVARHELRDLLEREGVGESVVYDATLVLSELVSNAVRHGRPTAAGHVEVSWSLEPERLVLEVAELALEVLRVFAPERRVARLRVQQGTAPRYPRQGETQPHAPQVGRRQRQLEEE